MRLNKKFMRLAISQARKNLTSFCGGPFGAVIVKGGKVLAMGRNCVLKSDATSHAEINAIRAASRKLKTFDLSGCVIYSTNEPCPMCFSAIHWARIAAIVYGTGISDAAKRGFNELPISVLQMKDKAKTAVNVIPGYLYEECLDLLKDWDKSKSRPAY